MGRFGTTAAAELNPFISNPSWSFSKWVLADLRITNTVGIARVGCATLVLTNDHGTWKEVVPFTPQNDTALQARTALYLSLATNVLNNAYSSVREVMLDLSPR